MSGPKGFDESVQRVLRRLEMFGRENDATQSDRRRKMLNLERETAELIHLMLCMSRRTRILEIGTSNGYSTIWLAATLKQNGGRVLTSVECDTDKLVQAGENLTQAGLADRVRLIHGDATAAVAALSGPFDCVFFDADRISAPEQLRLLLPCLTPDALLLADNALSHPAEIQGYIDAVAALPTFTAQTIPVGKGLHVAWRSSVAAI